jgi:hypothetical protein
MILEVVGSDPTPVTLQSAILAFFYLKIPGSSFSYSPFILKKNKNCIKTFVTPVAIQ